MLLSDIAVKRPTLAIVANALLLVFGILAFTNLPLRKYPDAQWYGPRPLGEANLCLINCIC